MSRTASVTRTTKETDIRVELNLDGSADSTADTGIPFFDHMVQQLGKHAGWDLDVTCKGDLAVDGHHTVEDVGIAIGQALNDALGDKAGVRRFASIVVPLDEAAVEVALDLSGRNFVVFDVPMPAERGPYSEDTAQLIDGEVKQIVTHAHQEARRILREQRDLLERVTRRLLEKEVMEGEELRAMIAAGPTPQLAP